MTCPHPAFTLECSGAVVRCRSCGAFYRLAGQHYVLRFEPEPERDASGQVVRLVMRYGWFPVVPRSAACR